MLRRLFLIFILISAVAVMGCKIEGKITENGKGVEGITVTLSGDDSMSTTTDADGNYVFDKIKPGNYEVKPADAKYTFKPVSRNVKVGPKKITGADFEIATSPPPAILAPWSTYQGNAAHTGYVPVNLNSDDFSFGWDRELIKSAPLNRVAAGDGKVFITTTEDSGVNVVLALDSANGVELWGYDLDDFDGIDDIDFISPPAYANGTVFIQSGADPDSYLWVFDAEKSKPENAVFIREPYVNQSFQFYAPTPYEEEVNGEVNVGVYMGGSYRVEEGSSVFWFGGAYCFSFVGLSEIESWQKPLAPYEQWTPAINQNYVIAYTGPYNYKMVFNSLTVFDRLTGELEFSIPDPEFVSNEFDLYSMNLAPVLGSYDDVIVINGGRLISFDLANQKIGWEMSKNEGNVKGFSGQPSLAEGIIFAVYDGYLHALDEKDGSFIEDWQPWQPPQGESIVTPMIVTDNYIFVSTASTTYAVDLESQTQVWSYPAGGHLALSDEGVLFIATAEGHLIAIFTD